VVAFSLSQHKNIVIPSEVRAARDLLHVRVPHPFTLFVKGARVNHHNHHPLLHSHKFTKGAPGSAVWNLGLGFPFLRWSPNKTTCHPEERPSAKREARRRTRRRTSTLASCLPSQSRIWGAPPSICEGGSWGAFFPSSRTKTPVIPSEVRAARDLLHVQVPHPFTPFVKGARANCDDHHEHLHSPHLGVALSPLACTIRALKLPSCTPNSASVHKGSSSTARQPSNFIARQSRRRGLQLATALLAGTSPPNAKKYFPRNLSNF
jgi:hypothetical protein